MKKASLFVYFLSLATIATPKAMAEGKVIKLPAEFWDSQKNIVSEITSAHCNKILTRVKQGYDITYHLDGGKNHADNPVTYEESSATIKLKDPTKTGYTFKGWYSDSKFTKKVKSIPKGSEGNKTLYAKWTANEYNIAFKGNGSNSGSMKKMTDRKYGKSYTLSKNAFKRAGYTFSGWNTKADGSGTSYKNKASVKNLSSKNGSTVTLYAQWKPKTYKIVYHNLNGGTNHSKNPLSYDITTATITLKSPSLEGYTFKGWYSDKNCTKKVKSIKKGSTGDQTVYAKWEVQKYSIKYYLNKGKNNSKNPKSYTVTTSTIKLQKPTRKGYTFKGWYSDKGLTQKVTMIQKGSTGNKTLYAKWVKK